VIDLYDAQGRIIKSVFDGTLVQGKNDITVDVGEISAGIYIYAVFIDGQKRNLKMIKQ